jgi:hypothetical protein
MVIYPIAMIILATWFEERAWFWWVAALCALAWVGAILTFLANQLHREGYQAAIDDMTARHVEEP